jgi:hypothetical protein
MMKQLRRTVDPQSVVLVVRDAQLEVGSLLNGLRRPSGIDAISAGSESSSRASDLAQANRGTCGAGMDKDLLLPSE